MDNYWTKDAQKLIMPYNVTFQNSPYQKIEQIDMSSLNIRCILK